MVRFAASVNPPFTIDFMWAMGGTPKWNSWKQSQRRKRWHNAVLRLSDRLLGCKRRIWSLERRHSCNLSINTVLSLSSGQFGVLIQLACHLKKMVTEAGCQNNSHWEQPVWWAWSCVRDAPEDRASVHCQARTCRFLSKLWTKRPLNPFESIYVNIFHICAA